jgi:Spy/CpxP family protein refolding chaperone
MKNVIWLLAIMLTITFVSQDNFAQKKFHEKGKEFREDFKKQLNLTEEQEKKMQELKLAHQEQMIKLRSDIELKELEIKKLVSAVNVSRIEIIKLTKELNTIKNEIDIARVNHKMDVYDLLDESQRNIWLDKQQEFGHMKCKMKNKMQERRNW